MWSEMGLDRKSALVLIVLFIIPACFTLYTYWVHWVAGYICEFEGEIWWTSSPVSSLFPWPRMPGGYIGLVPLDDEADLFMYRYLVKPLVLVWLSILMWTISAYFMFRVVKARRAHLKP